MRLSSLCLSPAVVAAFLFSLFNASAMTISPTNPIVSEGASQQFSSSVAATWKTSCASVSTGGLFHAPLYPGHCTVTATASSGSASTVVTIVSPIVMTPTAAQTPQGQQQQFTSSIPVDWTARCGTITSTGLYTASAPVETYCTIEGIALSGTKYTVYGYDKILSPPTTTFTVTPAQATVTEGATEQFVSSAAAGWSAICGTISSVGLFTAPLIAENCTITATATSGGQTASALADIVSPITITPVSPTTSPLATQQFTANIAVSWSSSCGSIDAAGLFTAPGTAGACTILATASGGTQYTAQATDTVTATVGALNYLTWKNDNGRTGLQPQETVLTPANVNSTHFGVSWTMTPDGAVWGQPLYMSGLSIGGAPHNALFIATSNDSVYALDANNGAVLWKTSFLSAGVTSVSAASISYKMSVGILGTPVIDAATNTLYVVAMTSENGGTTFVHRLHALDVITGSEQPGSPVVISDTGFASVHQMQRPGLLLSNGKVYVAFGSFSDRPPYHGFLIAYDANTFAQVASFNDTPSGSDGGIWMSSAAPSADQDGNVYISTGNGTWNGTTNFGDSVVKLDSMLQVLDYFTPYDQATLDSTDKDLGAGGPLLVPQQTGPFPDEVVICGKPSPVYLLNAEHLGEIGTTSDNVIQELAGIGQGPTHQACFSTPAYWNHYVYFIGYYDVLKMFSLSTTTGLLSSAPLSQSSFRYSYPGAQPVVSANETSNAIVWAVDGVSQTLRAYDATNMSKALYISPMLGSTVTWEVPTVVDGHVYLGMAYKVVAFSSK